MCSNQQCEVLNPLAVKILWWRQCTLTGAPSLRVPPWLHTKMEQSQQNCVCMCVSMSINETGREEGGGGGE